MSSIIITASARELASKQVLRIKQDNTEVLLVWNGGQPRAYSGVCPHLGGPMLESRVTSETITCPWHEYAFEADTGKCLTPPGEKWASSHGPARTCTKPMNIHLKQFEIDRDGDTLTIHAQALPSAATHDPKVRP